MKEEFEIIKGIIQKHNLENMGNSTECNDIETDITHEILVKLHYDLSHRIRLIEAHEK